MSGSNAETLDPGPRSGEPEVPTQPFEDAIAELVLRHTIEQLRMVADHAQQMLDLYVHYALPVGAWADVVRSARSRVDKLQGTI